MTLPAVSSRHAGDDAPRCSRGWGERCPASHGPKCRCACGGQNHGKAVGGEARRTSASDRHARFDMVRSDEREVVIRDVGPWDKHLTVTNDAEYVVRELSGSLRGRRLFYFDSGGRCDELLVRNGRFVGFAPGPLQDGAE